MSGLNKILGIALVVQLGLVAATWSTGGSAPARGTQTMFDFEAAAVTRFTVTNKPKAGEPEQTLVLARQGEGWVVASADDYPADAKKVTDVLDKLVALKIREPVATQAASHNALKVGERDYDKRLELTAGGTAHPLRVGGAKGTAIHVRREGEADVFLGRGVSAWAISDRVSTYVDTAYVKVEEPDRVTVRNAAGTITVVKGPQGWSVDELPGDVEVDPARVSAFVAAARAVQLAEPVGKTVKPEHGLDAGVKVEVVAGEAVTTYTIGALDADAYYVKASDNPFVIKASKFSLETLVKQTPDRFIKEAAAPPPPRGGMMPGGGMPGGMMPGGMGHGRPMMPPPGH